MLGIFVWKIQKDSLLVTDAAIQETFLADDIHK